MRVGIIGNGRFGKVLYRLLSTRHDVVIYDEEPTKNESDMLIDDILDTEVIFIAVPINKFENVVKDLKPKLTKQLVIDVLSVKCYPAEILKRYDIRAVLTHPMFGPDSSKNGFDGLTIVINQFSASQEEYELWKNFFIDAGLNVIELSPDEHDKLAAYSQGVTHFVGRTLSELGFRHTPIDTSGAKKLLEIMEQTCNDTFELFSDLQTYNPYTKEMRLKLGNAVDTSYSKLLPTQVHADYITYGIQGGQGSFNEEALLKYLANKNQEYKIEYMFTTKNVLQNLHEGNIDLGLFAICNTIGGIVDETVDVLGKYKFEIVEQITLNIRHFLMKRQDVNTNEIKQVMAHPQVFKQCTKTLQNKYASLPQIVGTGELIDTANAAKALSLGELNRYTAILGPSGLAELFNLEIIDSNLQDNDDNRTTFLLISRLT
jgi:prephenate dehydrogenase